MRVCFNIKDNELRVREFSDTDQGLPQFSWEGLDFVLTQDRKFTISWNSYLPDLEPEKALQFLRFIGARYPMSSDYQSLWASCPEIVFQTPEDEWVFFGGSFNPWHSGHQACLELLDETKFCLVLPDHNPFKDLSTEDSPVAKTLELSSKIRFKRRQFLVPTFLLKPEKNPTVDWVEKIRSDFPTKKLSLLLGFDSFTQILSWTRGEDLARALHKIYVVSRQEEDEVRIREEELLRARVPSLQVEFLGRHAFEELSSTKLRSERR